MVWRTFVACALLTLPVAEGAAQPARMGFLRNSSSGVDMVEVDVTPPRPGAPLHRSPIPASVFGGRQADVPFVLAGGRFIVWINWGRSGADARAFSIFDRRTGTAVGPLGDTVATNLVADPLRPRLFVPGAVHAGLPAAITMFDADTGALTVVLPAVACCEFPGTFAYASAVDQLIVPMLRPFVSIARAKVIDVATATISREIPWPVEADAFEAIETSADGRRLYVKASNRLFLLDGITGTVLARSAPFAGSGARLVAGSRRTVIVDERAGRVIVPHAGRLVVFDAITLATVADPLVGDPDGLLFAFKGLGPVGAFTVAPTSTASCVIDVWDNSYVTRLAPSVPCPDGVFTPLLTMVPASPESLDARIVGARQVRLAWSDPGDTSAYEVLVGMTPGAADLVIAVGRSTTATFSGVPPGVYYVRVRGVNQNGAGFASAAVTVAVQ